MEKQRKRKRGERIRGLYLPYQNDELQYIGMSNNVNFRLYQHSYSSHLVELNGEYNQDNRGWELFRFEIIRRDTDKVVETKTE